MDKYTKTEIGSKFLGPSLTLISERCDKEYMTDKFTELGLDFEALVEEARATARTLKVKRLPYEVAHQLFNKVFNQTTRSLRKQEAATYYGCSVAAITGTGPEGEEFYCLEDPLNLPEEIEATLQGRKEDLFYNFQKHLECY